MLRLKEVEYNKFDHHVRLQGDYCYIHFLELKVDQDKELEIILTRYSQTNKISIELPDIAKSEIDLDTGKTTLLHNCNENAEIDIDSFPGVEMKIYGPKFSILIVCAKCESQGIVEVYKNDDNMRTFLMRFVYDIE